MVSAPMIQGRMVTPGILAQVRGLIAERPGWSRRRLALELCRQWQWYNAAGQIKDMAARSFLDKLEARGCIELPPRQRRRAPGFAPRLAVLPPAPTELKESLAQLRPLQWEVFSARQPQAARFNAYLARYHYLPYCSTVGKTSAIWCKIAMVVIWPVPCLARRLGRSGRAMPSLVGPPTSARRTWVAWSTTAGF